MEKRFILPAVVAVSIFIIAIVLTFVIAPGEGDAVPILPGNTKSDFVFVIIIPFAAVILSLFYGPFIAINLARLHKIIRLKKYDYFVTPIEKKLTGPRIVLRSFYPGLLAINIAIYITLYKRFNGLFADANSVDTIPVVIEYIAVLIGIPIACLIIIPIWILQSSGLMCNRNIERYRRPVTPDIESVGSFYSKIMKGYVGISTVTTYSLILYNEFLKNSDASVYMLVFVDPFVIMLIFVVISLLLEMNLQAINKFLFRKLEKLGIKTAPQIIQIGPKQ